MQDPAEIFTKAPSFEHSEELKEISPKIFDNIIHNRRSVRVFTNEKIPTEVMEEVLNWGLMAPNSSNLQPWEFYWVQNPIKKAELVEACFDQPAAKTAQELIVVVARLDTWKQTRKEMLKLFEGKDVPESAKAYYQKLVPIVYNQGPLGIFGLGKRLFASLVGVFRPIPREPFSRADMRVWAVKSTALACQNIMMGFAAHGFDTCPMEGHDSKRVKKTLGLGRNAEITMIISVGKRSEKGVYGPRVRMNKERFIKRI